ncbi:MAG: hypothetical protein KDF59_15110 [Nitrosomonas sp.]|nr:hypothetical protein [Nitrosomonas sp.]
MRSLIKRAILVVSLLFLVACVSMPDGPSVMALPGKGKNLDQFRHDDVECRHFAHEQIGETTAKEAAVHSGFNSAAIGAALGAIVGFVFGSGESAAVGAGMGFLAGGLSGTDNAKASGFIHQQSYDQGYIQCMYAKGHKVPVTGEFSHYPQQTGRNISSMPPPQPSYRP